MVERTPSNRLSTSVTAARRTPQRRGEDHHPGAPIQSTAMLKTQLGCLAPLILFAAIGLYLQLTNGFSEDGGGRFALMGLMGLIAALAANALRRLATRNRPEPPGGFPIEPRHPNSKR